MGADRLPDVVLELWTQGGVSLVRATVDGVPTAEVVAAPETIAKVRAFADRVAQVAARKPKRAKAPNGERAAQVARCIEKHGYVSSRLLAAISGMTREAAGWHLSKMGQRGELVRTGPREWRWPSKGEAAE